MKHEYNNTNPPSDKLFIEWMEKEHWVKHTRGPMTMYVNQVKIVKAMAIFELYDMWYKKQKLTTKLNKTLSGDKK